MPSRYLYLNSRDEFYRIEVASLVYFEADGNYTKFMLANKVGGVTCMNLSQTQAMLTESLKDDARMFARIGKRFIVNLNYIFHIHILKQQLVLSDGKHFAYQLPISKDALKNLREVYTKRNNN